MAERRPAIVIPARFSRNASALRFHAEVAARALVEAVYRAGGEPLLMHPDAPGGQVDLVEVRDRLAIADGVLLPGGGDLDPRWAGQRPHPSQYDVDIEQDAFDLAVARVALAEDLPLLAICRGAQVVNVALGGDVVQDMEATVGQHRHRTHRVKAEPGSVLGKAASPDLTVSCYHHQCLGRVGNELEVVARAEDGVIEGVEMPSRRAWFVGVQWHPEDTAEHDPSQAGLFTAFVAAARKSS